MEYTEIIPTNISGGFDKEGNPCVMLSNEEGQVIAMKLSKVLGNLSSIREIAEIFSNYGRRKEYWENYDEKEKREHYQEMLDEDDSKKPSYSICFQLFNYDLDNNKGAYQVAKEFKKFYGKSATISPDPESSYSYFYFQSVDEGIAFDQWMYENYVKASLKKLEKTLIDLRVDEKKDH